MMCHYRQSKLSWDSKIGGKAKTRIDPRDRTLKLLGKVLRKCHQYKNQL